MGPRDNRIHSDRTDSPATPSQNDSITKSPFRDLKTCQNRPRARMSTPRPKNMIRVPKIDLGARQDKRCTPKFCAEPCPRNCKRSHIVQVRVKTHLGVMHTIDKKRHNNTNACLGQCNHIAGKSGQNNCPGKCRKMHQKCKQSFP